MESINSYLHKKFKKQLSVTPKVQNDKENKDTPRTEQSEEKTTAPQETATDSRIVYRQTPSEYNQPVDKPSLDNNDSVPKQSTKNSTVNFSKSSISLVEPQQSSNSYISHVVSNQAASFDTTFKEQTNHSTALSPSSILDSHYSRPSHEYTYLNCNSQEEYPATGASDSPDPEPPAPPDKNVNGKYVCPYCSLVCSKPSVLQKHIRAHTNERPFPCTSCGFSFKTRSNLYKHCRSRTHANRVMGTKSQDGFDSDCQKPDIHPANASEGCDDPAAMQKPYKPRFHTALAKENVEQEEQRDLSYHINDIINKNNSIVHPQQPAVEEPLNLTSKNRKRSLSELSEPVVPKSLIKELLLKNLSASDMQCPHCKMLFQTVTELDVHKYRGNCKGRSLGAKYGRSSSVNVASILTQNKNAFDGLPQLQNPLNSPGPFLGHTRLVDGDRAKTFSFEDKKPGLKLFGGEVKVQGVDDAKSFREDKFEPEPRYGKGGDNRVVKSSLLQSGGSVVTNKPDQQEGLRVFEADVGGLARRFALDRPPLGLERREEGPVSEEPPSPLYRNIMDFSQTVLRRLTPNLKQPSLTLARPSLEITLTPVPDTSVSVNPVNLLVDGKLVRHVPGMPGPVAASDATAPRPLLAEKAPPRPPEKAPVEPNQRRFTRPSSLALKPTVAFSKQHHGLTPTMFNQILISPETPRGAKKCAEHLIQGNYFSYLGLKSSTKPVYCTLNKTQPFYVPHFKRLSMYSEWRQQDTRQDRLYVSGYDSRQRGGGYTVAGRSGGDLMTHSSYKFMVCDSSHGSEKDDEPQKNSALLGGYESNEDYTYIRGRGRGRYVCDQCGIRCKKPSMLKKHIRTHSNDRPYTCGLCNFSFKTKGNLTKHMKSKAHSKNSTASSGSSSSTQLSAHSSDSDTDDSGMDSSDESTRQQEHEAAYGLLSLSQKPAPSDLRSRSPGGEPFMSAEEVALVSHATFARNKILGGRADATPLPPAAEGGAGGVAAGGGGRRGGGARLGTAGAARPLTYPYSAAAEGRRASPEPATPPEPKSIKQFHVIQKYLPQLSPKRVEPLPEKVHSDNTKPLAPEPPTLKINDVATEAASELRKRKLPAHEPVAHDAKAHKSDEVMDLSTTQAPDNARPLAAEDAYDNSAMETLADIATKQVKLEKNTLAKSVASEFLKLATKNEGGEGGREAGYAAVGKGVDDLIAKSEGNKSCTVCAKSFNKPSQLRLHMNIHYLERPFRCESCSVSFRTKGHLQKHERSAGHNNKLSSSPTLSSSEPRPFKCTDCSIAFRIHGHLAKHLRSKLHIMKLECLAKIPFGLYAELERSNSLLTEINTCDGDQCLESLKILAKKVLINEPSKLNPVEIRDNFNAD